MEEMFAQIARCVIVGHVDANSPHPVDMRGEPGTRELAQSLIDAGATADTVLASGLLKGMEEVGRRFRENEYYIPDVLASCMAMRAGSEVLKPHLAQGSASPRGVFVIGTVEGDLHDIGKSLVSIMLEGAGYEVVDLGVNVPAQRFVEAARDHPGAPIGMSAMLSTTMVAMGKVITALREAALDPEPVTVVGGAPVTQAFADQIGASAYAPNAGRAVDVLMGLSGDRAA